MNRAIKGFTLVELIVVITILAILGSIAFISLQEYGKGARDSARISDIANFRTGIEIFNTEAGVYPMPDSVDNSILVSGNPANYPGTTGELVASIARISTPLIDPGTGEEYGYSIEGNMKSYQLLYSLEDDSTASLIRTVNAQEFIETRIIGTYNGVIAKTKVGGIATMPSLFTKATITGDITAGTPVEFKVSGETPEVTFTPNEIVYTDLEDLIAKVQEEYNDVSVPEIIKSSPVIKDVVSLDPTNTGDQGSFEGTVLSTSNSSSGTSSTGSSSGGSGGATSLVGWRAIDPACEIDDIVIGDQTWAGCNSREGTGLEWGYSYTGVLASTLDCSKNFSGATANSIVDCGPVENPSLASDGKDSDFFTGTNVYGDTAVNNIWGKYYPWDNAVGNVGDGACPSGRHVPSSAEWGTLASNLGGSLLGWKNHSSAGKDETNNVVNALKLTLSGYGHNEYSFYHLGNYGFYWASEYKVSEIFNVASEDLVETTYNQTYGFSVRCIKD